MADWYDVPDARAEWPDAPDDDGTLEQLLEVAQSAVLAYAPALAADAVGVPVTYRHAQLMQARNIWNSSRVSPSSDFAGGDFTMTTYPLDWQIRQILRPKRGVPVIA